MVDTNVLREAAGYTGCDTISLAADELDALRAKVERRKPVVEAACAWLEAKNRMPSSGKSLSETMRDGASTTLKLEAAVIAYQAKEAGEC